MLNRGQLTALNRSIFKANTAGEGPAIMNEGEIENLFDLTLDDNMLRCSAGTYGYNADSGAEEVMVMIMTMMLFIGGIFNSGRYFLTVR